MRRHWLMDGNFFGVRLGVLVGVACLAACSASSSFDPASHQQQAKVDIVEALLPAPGTPWFGDAPGAACADRAHAVVASLSVSRQGDIVIAGHFDGRADFGAGPLDPSGGSSFVAAFTPSGHIRWSRAVAADNIAVTYDGVGNVDVLHGAYDVVNVPGGTAAIDQFGGDGSPRWTREVDPAPDKDHEGIALAVQPDNSVTVSVPGRLVHLDRAGTVISATTFEDVSANAIGFSSSGAPVISGVSQVLISPLRTRGFVAKKAPDGSDMWRVPVVGPDSGGFSDAFFSATDHGTALSGFFFDRVTVGATEVLASPGPRASSYLALVNDDGTVAWAREISEFGVGEEATGFNEPVRSVAFDDSGAIILAFGQGEVVALGAFDRTGRRTWTRRYSGLEQAHALAAPVPGSTEIVVAGSGHLYGCADGCDPCDNRTRPFLFRVTRSGDLASGFEGHL